MSLIFSTCFVLVCQPFLGTSYLREMTGLNHSGLMGGGIQFETNVVLCMSEKGSTLLIIGTKQNSFYMFRRLFQQCQSLGL